MSAEQISELSITSQDADEVAHHPGKALAWVTQNESGIRNCRIVVRGEGINGGVLSQSHEMIDQLRSALRCLLSERRMFIRMAGENILQTTDLPPPKPPLIMEPEEMVADLTSLAQSAGCSSFDVPDDHWEQHLYNADASLRYHRLCQHHELDNDEKYSRLVGYCSEVILHSLLLQLCAREYDEEERRIRLTDVSDFRNKIHPCSICATQSHSFIVMDKTRSKVEVDDIVLTGLDPNNQNYCGMYLFDATASVEYFNRKIRHGLSGLDEFFKNMSDTPKIECDLFTVLLYDREKPVSKQNLSVVSHERSHVITLPLLQEANDLAEKTFEALDECEKA